MSDVEEQEVKGPLEATATLSSRIGLVRWLSSGPRRIETCARIVVHSIEYTILFYIVHISPTI